MKGFNLYEVYVCPSNSYWLSKRRVISVFPVKYFFNDAACAAKSLFIEVEQACGGIVSLILKKGNSNF